MPPKYPCLHYTTSISFSITLSSSYLCRSPTMTAVLSSVAGLLDGCSLNSSWHELVDKGHNAWFLSATLEIWVVGSFFGCRVPSIFDQRSFRLNQAPIRRRTLWKSGQAGCITVKRAMMDMLALVMRQAGPWRTAVSTLQRLCPRLISHGSLIRVKWLQYWPCGRGFQSRTGPAYCWLLFAIPHWARRIDQVICWVHGQRLSVPMPAWLTRWNLLPYNPLNSLDNSSDLLLDCKGVLVWQCPSFTGYCVQQTLQFEINLPSTCCLSCTNHVVQQLEGRWCLLFIIPEQFRLSTCTFQLELKFSFLKIKICKKGPSSQNNSGAANLHFSVQPTTITVVWSFC